MSGHRHMDEVSRLRNKVDEGAIDAKAAAAAPIINPLTFNKAHRRKKRVTPPEQFNMASFWGSGS